MAIELKHHINLRSDNPLEATIGNRNTKAYIIAKFALADGAEATAELYEMSLGAVYAAMSFYEDNRDAIQQAIEEARAISFGENEINASDAVAGFKRRMEDKNKR